MVHGSKLALIYLQSEFFVQFIKDLVSFWECLMCRFHFGINKFTSYVVDVLVLFLEWQFLRSWTWFWYWHKRAHWELQTHRGCKVHPGFQRQLLIELCREMKPSCWPGRDACLAGSIDVAKSNWFRNRSTRNSIFDEILTRLSTYSLTVEPEEKFGILVRVELLGNESNRVLVMTKHILATVVFE